MLASLGLPPARGLERDAFREHLLSSIWGGISGGLGLLTDVILAKTLRAPGWQVTLLATLGPAANLFSLYWAGQMAGRRKGGFFLQASLLGRFPLLLMLLWKSSGMILALYFLYAMASALAITASNAIYQARYGDRSRPHYFALSTSVGALFIIGASQAAGALLAWREQLYPWLFAVCGLTGWMALYHLYRMELEPGEPRGMLRWFRLGWQSLWRRLAPPPGQAAMPGVRHGTRLILKVLRDNPGFARFERDFMIYGIAFMCLVPVLPLYVVRDLKMNYHQLSAATGLWGQVGIVLLSPILGVALARLRPLRFTGRIFLLLALYPLCLLVSTLPGIASRIGWVYASLLFFSIAMAGVNLSWTLGSMHFAGKQDASAFQGAHVSLTGVRGLLAPSMGFLIYRYLGTAAVFSLSAGLFLLAGVLMLQQDRETTRRSSAPKNGHAKESG